MGLIIGGLLLLWFALPLWFPWILRPLATKENVHYTRYERLGYANFAIHGLSFTNQDIRLKAERIETVVPSVWLWRLARKDFGQTFFAATDWELESLPSGGPSTPVYAQASEVNQVAKTLERWLPTAVLSNGTVRVQGQTLPIPAATWNQAQLDCLVELPPKGQIANLKLDFAKQPQTLDFVSEALGLSTDARISLGATNLEIKGEGSWRSNQFELAGEFGLTDSLPAKAHFEARSFSIPAQWIYLPAYREINGSVSANWQTGAFGLDLAVQVQPGAGNTNRQPIQVSLHSHGDTNSAIIDSARVSGPWVELELSKNLQIYFQGPLMREPGSLNLSADLNRQPWLPLKGKLSGTLEFTPTAQKFPDVGFRLHGSNIVHAVVSANSLDLKGSLKWPWLEVDAADAAFADNSKASLQVKVQLETEYIGEGQFSFQGGLPRKWLPEGYSFEELSARGTVQGTLDDLKHRGHLDVTDFTAPELRPLQIGMDWQGEQTNVLLADLVASSGKCSLHARLGISNELDHTELELTQLSLRTNEETLLELTQPSRMAFERSSQTNEWLLRTTPVHLEGTGGQLQVNGSVTWPERGVVEVSVQKMETTILAPFLKEKIPDITVKRLSTWAHWTNGPASFGALLSASGTPPSEVRLPTVVTNTLSTNLLVDLELTAGGNPNGIVLSNLEVTSLTSSVVIARGFLPMTLHPGAGTNTITFDTEHSLFFNAAVQPQAFFWRVISNWSGLGLVEPNLQVNVSGTWPAPKGKIELSAQRIELSGATWRIPKLENLQINLSMDRQVARLTKGELLVQGQPATLTGELPLGEQVWRDLKKKNLPAWSEATVRLRVENAQLAAFAHLLPELLTPQGELSLELSMQPGANIEGYLWLHDARTRPLANAGPLRDIEMRMTLENDRLRLESAAARVGGANVVLSGVADLHGTNWWGGQLPPFSVSLRGINVPLSRQPDSIVRSDLLLALTKTNGAPPMISGLARLRDSFYLSDLSSLVPTGVATPSRRPPYFSLETPGLADWRLGVRVEGPGFLHVSSPLFSGRVSANLRVNGTLKDPIALGDLRIDSGLVRFPFASLQVQQGLVNLTSDDPYHPHLFVNATSRQYGFDIRMEVTGPVDAPILQFTSTPPLSSQQILLMVTAGQLPRGQNSLSSQQKAETAALFLGRDVLSKIGIGGEAEQRITIRAGQDVSEQGRSTYDVEIKLTDDWSVEGEYDRFGDFNAGVKWRVYSK